MICKIIILTKIFNEVASASLLNAFDSEFIRSKSRLITTLLWLLILFATSPLALAVAEDGRAATIVPNGAVKHYHTDSISVEGLRIKNEHSASKLNDSTLTLKEINNVKELSTMLPGLFVPNYGSSVSSGLYYRGIGNRYSGSGITVYIDGVPCLQGLETSLNLYDAFDVTLNQQSDAITGAVGSGLGELFIKTSVPGSVMQSETEQAQLAVAVSYGNANSTKINIQHNDKLGDLYYGILFNGYYTDGFEINAFNGKHADSKKEYSTAIKLNWQIAPNLNSQTKISYNWLDENSFVYRLYENTNSDVLHPAAFNDPNSYKNNVFQVTETLNWAFAKNLNLISTTNIAIFNDIMQLDQDFSSENIFTLIQEQYKNRFYQNLQGHGLWAHGGWAAAIELDRVINSPLTADIMFKRQGIEDLIESNVTANVPGYVEYKILDSNFFIPNEFVDDNTDFGIYYRISHKNILFDGLAAQGAVRLNYNESNLNYNIHSQLTQSYNVTYMGMNIFDTIQTAYQAADKSSKNNTNILPSILITYKDSKFGELFSSFRYGLKKGGFNIQMLADIAQSNLRSNMISNLKNSLYSQLTTQGMPSDIVNNVILKKIPDFPLCEGNIADILWYNPETNYNYELGWKNNFQAQLFNTLNIDWNISTTLYYIKIENLQLTQFSPNGFGRMLTNAGAAASKGLEISAKLQPVLSPNALVQNLTFDINYSFADARFTKYIDTIRNSSGAYEMIDYRNNRIPYAPSNIIHIAASAWLLRQASQQKTNLYSQGRVLVALQYTGVGGIFWNESNTRRQNYYGVVSAKISVSYKNWTFELWGKNLSNKRYYTFYFESLSKEFYQTFRPLEAGINIKYNKG